MQNIRYQCFIACFFCFALIFSYFFHCQKSKKKARQIKTPPSNRDLPGIRHTAVFQKSDYTILNALFSNFYIFTVIEFNP